MTTKKLARRDKRGVVARFSALPIALVGAHAIMLGTLLSAAELDGWIDWGHEASIAMVVPILLRIVANATE